MDVLKQRFKCVEVSSADAVQFSALGFPIDVWSQDRSGERTSALVSHGGPASLDAALRARFPGATKVEVRDASLRELFVALARRAALDNHREVAA
jgi:hypothetical protein